jgi:hypothetical protein
VWTMGFASTAYADRGTGYNYFDGTSWGEMPTARLEPQKNGWPSYAPLGDGEMVITHRSSGNLSFTHRPIKGTGAWTTDEIPGTSGYAWPRAITVGNTIHLIVNTYVLYEGLTNALVYLRSTDAGATWSTPTILPGLDAASLPLSAGFLGFGGDEYAWAAPKGDTIAFACGNMLGGIWLEKSFDGGDTWTHTTVYEFPPTSGTENPDIATFDEIFAVALDNQGEAHMALTRYIMATFDATASSWTYYPYMSDGIIYWNETMPQIDYTLLHDYDSLAAHGMWIAGMQDMNGNDTLDFPDVGTADVPWGGYRYVNLCSFPQINIDNDNNMFVSYSALREDLVNSGANPTAQIYRHLYVTSKLNFQTEWSEPLDLTDDILHSYDEVVWAYMVIGNDGKLHFLCQIDSEPGTAIGADADEPGDNYMTYITFPTFVNVKPADIARNVMVSPNPASDFTNVNITLTDSRKVELNVYDAMGKLVVTTDLGKLNSGDHSIRVSTSLLPAGIYLFNVQAGTSTTTKKVVIK